MSDSLLSFLEKNSASFPRDYGARVMLANVYYLNNEPERSFAALKQLCHDAAQSDYGEYAKFTLNYYSYFDDSNRPEIIYHSYEEIAQNIFERKNRRSWDRSAMLDYYALLKNNASIKWVPFAIIEVLDFFFLNNEYETCLEILEFISANYPQSWWDARARVKKLDIDYIFILDKLKRYKELLRTMEFRKKSGVLQQQADVDERLSLESEAKNLILAFEENVVSLVQRYKKYKISRDQFFKLASLFEEQNSARDVLRVLSHVNNYFNDMPEGAKAHFEIGMHYFRSEDYQMAFQCFNDYLANYADGREIVQAVFMCGKTLQMQKRFQEALSFFKKTLAYKDEVWSKEAANSALEVGKNYYSGKKYIEALKLLGEMRAAQFDDDIMAEAAFIEGCANRDLSLSLSKAEAPEYVARAVSVFRHLIERYPESIYSSMARVSLHEIESGKLNNSMFISRVSNLILAVCFIGFFVLMGYSSTKQEEPLFFLVFVLQLGLVSVLLFFLFSFKFLGRIWDYFFG